MAREDAKRRGGSSWRKMVTHSNGTTNQAPGSQPHCTGAQGSPRGRAQGGPRGGRGWGALQLNHVSSPARHTGSGQGPPLWGVSAERGSWPDPRPILGRPYGARLATTPIPGGQRAPHGLCQSPRAKRRSGQLVSLLLIRLTSHTPCEEQVGTRVFIKNSKCLYTVLLTFA